MSSKIKLALAGAAAVLLLILLGATANAWTQFRTGNSATVAAGQTVDSSLWVGAKNIDIAGTVNGDVFCAGQTVNISGTVKGDLICAAQTLNISGNIQGSLRLAAQTVNFTGSADHSAAVAGQTINIDAKSRIASDASLAGSDINVNGSIGRDLSAAGGNLNINGSIGRDVKSVATQVTLASGAQISGGLDYTSKNKLIRPSGAYVGGMVTYHSPKAHHRSAVRLAIFSGGFAVFVGIVLILAALIATALFPQVVNRVAQHGLERPWWALLTGFVASVVVPILFLLLMVSVIGFPLAILLLLGWLMICLTSGLFSAYLLGRWVWRSQRNALVIVLVGSLLLVILYFIPIGSIIAFVLATWVGEGMILLELKRHLAKPRYQVK